MRRGALTTKNTRCRLRPGGPTKFGITIHDYRKYVKRNATAADVRAMALDDAKAIYRAKYWNALRCDELPAGLDYCVFDYGVNSGVSRAAKVLQRMLSLKDDGRVTNTVIAAARRRSATTLINQICNERMAFLKRLKTWRVFNKGWTRQVAEVRAASLAMAGVAPAKREPAKSNGPTVQRSATAIVVAAGAGATQQTAMAYGAGTAVVVCTTAIIAAIACWLALGRWRRRKQEAQ